MLFRSFVVVVSHVGSETSTSVEPIISPIILNVWALHISDPFISIDALEVLEVKILSVIDDCHSMMGCLHASCLHVLDMFLTYYFQFITDWGNKILLVDVLKIHISTSFLLVIYLCFLFIPYIKKGKHNRTGIFMKGTAGRDSSALMKLPSNFLALSLRVPRIQQKVQPYVFLIL